MLVMPPTAAPTAMITRSAVPRNSATSERASVRDTGNLRADRNRSPESPASATTVRAGDQPDATRRLPTGNSVRGARRSAVGGPAVEDVLDDAAGAPGGAAVVV